MPRRLPRLPKFKPTFRNSHTIVVARITDVGGFITAVLGALDWSPLLGLSGFDRKQMIATGAVILLIGISHEIARRMP
jgi:hypothetical protein